MLQTFYNNFGFVGALAIAFFIFLFFIFWIAGIAGLCMKTDTPAPRHTAITVLAVLIPPIPFIWMVLEIYTQQKMLRKTQ